MNSDKWKNVKPFGKWLMNVRAEEIHDPHFSLVDRIVGDPAPTDYFSSAELAAMGMVGVYERKY